MGYSTWDLVREIPEAKKAALDCYWQWQGEEGPTDRPGPLPDLATLIDGGALPEKGGALFRFVRLANARSHGRGAPRPLILRSPRSHT